MSDCTYVYECLSCGHVFDPDDTYMCPECGSQDIDEMDVDLVVEDRGFDDEDE